MIFSKKNRLLLYIYSQSKENLDYFCNESDIQVYLNINYKQIHVLADYWEKRSCIKSFTQRGGLSSYKITSYGVIEAKKVKKNQNLAFLIMGVFILLIFFIFLGY